MTFCALCAQKALKTGSNANQSQEPSLCGQEAADSPTNCLLNASLEDAEIIRCLIGESSGVLLGFKGGRKSRGREDGSQRRKVRKEMKGVGIRISKSAVEKS